MSARRTTTAVPPCSPCSCATGSIRPITVNWPDVSEPFPKKGLSGLELKELAAAEGFQAYSFAGDTPEMLEHLRQGRPLITVIDPSVLTANNHYVVLVGWDESRREWIVHDPVKGPYQRRPAGEMARQRSRLDNWTLLVIPETPS